MSFRLGVGTRQARRLAATALALLAGTAAALPRVAAADDSVSQCMQSYEAGQRLRREGDLVGAAGELLVCGGPACPVRMQSDCQRWIDDVQRATPEVVFRVRDAGGTWLGNVSVTIDDAPARRLDGRAIAMNPGEHVIVFERDGYRPLRTPIIVAEGEKLERRVITLRALDASSLDAPAAPASDPLQADASWQASAASSPERSAGASALPGAATTPPVGAESRNLLGPLALGAVAVAGGIGFVYFGVHAQSGEADLEQCTPNCSQARVDDVKDDFLRSNVSLGIGLAGLVGAGLWLLLDRPATVDGSHARDARGARTSWGLGPMPYWEARF